MNTHKGKTGRFAVSMLKVGIIGFGGGNALIPLIEKEAVQKEKFLTEEDFERKVVVASITPGALPIELAGGIGRQLSGMKGMLIGASAIAFPGTAAMLIMLVFTLLASQSVIHQIEFLFVGITGYILCLLAGYLKGTIQKVPEKSRYLHIMVMCIVFFITGMKNIYKIMGIHKEVPVSLSTSQVFAVVFFFMIYTGKKKSKVNMMVVDIICLFYIFSGSNMMTTEIKYLHFGISLVMFVLGTREFGKSIMAEKDIIRDRLLKNVQWTSVVKGLLISMIVIIPAVFVTKESIPFMGKGILSSWMSFGGGDAYLTVADGLFIDEKMISEDLFYGYLVPIVNVLPGSILCKVLSGIGYMIGYHASQNILAGCVVAIAGFFCGIFASCSVFGIVENIYEILDELPVFCKIKRWIRTVVSGLMLSVISSLIYQNVRLQRNYGYRYLTVITMGIFMMDSFMQKSGIESKKIVMLSVSLAFVICNVLYA